MTITAEELQEIRARAEAGNAWPWRYDIKNLSEDEPKLLAEVERLRAQFAHISDMASELYEVDSVKNEWILRKSLEPHADFIDEIFIVSSEEAGLVGNE